MLQEQLHNQIAAIRKTLDKVKENGGTINEAQTEHYIIDPLLAAFGYELWEIVKRGHDNVARNFPDYTLLPSSPHKWFLEVKRLDHPLQEGEAAQAVNYAAN